MKKSVIVEAPAKINLVFDITGKREDGYHEIHSVMQTIDLFDTITLSRMSGKGIYISCDRTRIPCDANNLAHIAARRFFEAYNITDTEALSIDLQKRIPIQAGLGGGSTDAAAVLVGLNAMYEIHASQDDLCGIGIKVGADVPFCIKGGTMHVRGIGDKLSSLPPMPAGFIVLAKPARGMSTTVSYRRYDQLENPPRADVGAVLKSLDFGDLHGVARHTGNVLEAVCSVAEVGQLKERMLRSGALGAAMSGSGSAVFGIFENKALAKRCMRRLYELSESVFLVLPCARGAVVVRAASK